MYIIIYVLLHPKYNPQILNLIPEERLFLNPIVFAISIITLIYTRKNVIYINHTIKLSTHIPTIASRHEEFLPVNAGEIMVIMRYLFLKERKPHQCY